MTLTPIKDQDVEIKSKALAGKRIGLAVCGGIAALETVKLVRELRRHGATVQAFITPSVKQFLTPLSLEWATTAPVVEQLGANAEHLEKIDLAIVAPLTLNTLSKLALGICNNAVTQMLATCFGRKTPVFLVPTMNSAMADHPLYNAHLERLESWGVTTISPLFEEGRLKFPPVEKIVDAVLAKK